MDEGWVALIGAGVSITSAALGVIAGYVSGRAQARGVVQGVRLQLSGQRSDALWQIEVDACTLYIDRANQALFKIGQTVAVTRLEPGEAESLSIYGIDTRDALLRDLRGIQDDCMLQEIAIHLRVPSDLAQIAKSVREALQATVQALYQWCAARTMNAENEPQKWHALNDQLDIFRDSIAAFIDAAQVRFTQPYPAATRDLA